MKLKILEVGAMVEDFKSGMFFILFGESAPPELREVSVIHEYEKSDDGVYFEQGTKITIKGVQYTVEEVGNQANKNFDELGHVSVYLSEHEILPGAIRVSPSVFPEFSVGEEIIIEK